jgi:hypothetical protein
MTVLLAAIEDNLNPTEGEGEGEAEEAGAGEDEADGCYRPRSRCARFRAYRSLHPHLCLRHRLRLRLHLQVGGDPVCSAPTADN